ncbi:unnamed protein product, partial [marine sediment metagenome]
YEMARRIHLLAGEEKGRLQRVLSWLDKSLGIAVSDSEAEAKIAAEREAVKESLTRQLSAKLAGKPRGEACSLCADNMLDTFLGLDLAEPGRDLIGLAARIARKYGVRLDPFDVSKLTVADIGRMALDRTKPAYEAREQELGPDRMRMIERYLLLQKIDTKWKDHLLAMDHLKGGIGLRGYAQVDPKVEYTREARVLFDQMRASVRREVSDLVMRLEPGGEERESSEIWSGGHERHTGMDPTAA